MRKGSLSIAVDECRAAALFGSRSTVAFATSGPNLWLARISLNENAHLEAYKRIALIVAEQITVCDAAYWLNQEEASDEPPEMVQWALRPPRIWRSGPSNSRIMIEPAQGAHASNRRTEIFLVPIRAVTGVSWARPESNEPDTSDRTLLRKSSGICGANAAS